MEQAPHRVSVDKSDPGYEPWIKLRSRGKDIRTLLDGVPVKYCVTADSDEGLVVRYPCDRNGRVLIHGDQVVMESVHGKVELQVFDF